MIGDLYPFLEGGGEMGNLTRNYDWSKTPIGALEDWPVSLRVQISLMLKSRFPMLVFWGAELITFYNDAFRPSLGEDGKHPGSLGQRGEESWAESWPVIGPMIYDIMAGGNAVWFEDQKLPIYREGQMGYAYWTYSFSAIINDAGAVNGILVTCSETTKGVESLQQLSETNAELKQSLEQNTALQHAQMKADAQFRNVTNSAPTGLWLSNEEGGLTYLNKTLADWTGMRYEDLLGAGWAAAIIDEDRQRAAETFLTAVAARAHYDVQFRINRSDGAVIWCRAAGDPFYNEDGSYGGYAGFCMDIQALVDTQQQMAESEARLRSLLQDAPVAATLFRGPDNVVEIANKLTLQYWGKGPEIIGKPLAEAAPELAGQQTIDLLGDMYKTGGVREFAETPLIFEEAGVKRLGHYTHTWKALYDKDGNVDSILTIGVDVSEQVAARKALEESSAQMRTMVESAPFPIGVYIGREMRIRFANQAIKDVYGKGDDVEGKLYTEILPELATQEVFEQLTGVYDTGIAFHSGTRRVDIEHDGALVPYYFNYSFTPLFDAGGSVYGVMNTAADVTELETARQKIAENEARFRTLLEEAPMAACLFTGRELTIALANEQMLQSWGKTPAVIGKTLREAMPELEGQPFFEVLDNVFTTGETYQHAEAPAQVEVNGELVTYYFNYILKALRNEAGEVYAIINTNTNVTGQVLARQQLELAVQIGDLGDYRIDLTTSICTYSPQLIEWFRLGGQGAAVSDFLNHVHPEDQEKVQLALSRSIEGEGGGRHDVTYRVAKADGSYRHLHSIGQVQWQEGVPTAIVGIIQDVTDQEEGRQALEASEARFRRLVTEAPVAIGLFRGRELVIETPNGAFIEVIGRGPDIEGKPLAQVMPELESQPFLQLLDGVFTSGETFRMSEARLIVVKNGIPAERYFNLTFSPLFEDGKVTAIMDISVDVTEQVLARRKIEDSEARFRAVIEQAPMAVGMLEGRDMVITLGNAKIFELWGKPPTVTGLRLIEALPELDGQPFMALLEAVFDTGVPFFGNGILARLERNAVLEDIYFDFTYAPVRNAQEQVTGVLVLATDVTERELAAKAIADSEARFRSLIQEAPVATCLFVGREQTIEVANELMLGLWGKDSSIIGKRLEDAVPELKGQPFIDILDGVFTTGKPYSAYAARAELEVGGILGTYYFNFTYKPLFNEAGEVYGIIDMAIDVTGQVLARQAVEESEAKLRAIVENAQAAIAVYAGKDMLVENPNQAFIDIMGKGPDIAGKPLRVVMPELLTEGQPFLNILDDVYTTGIPFVTSGTLIKIFRGGEMTNGYYNFSYSPVFDSDGKVYQIVVVATDVTEQIEARHKVEEAQARLSSTIALAELGTWSVDLATNMATWSQRHAEIFGMDAASIDLEKAMASVVEEDRERVKQIFFKTLEPGADRQYNAEYQIINEKTGKRLTLQAVGQAVVAETGIPVSISGTVRDITLQREQQAALEAEVQLRTEELAAAVEELQTTNEELEESNAQLSHSNDELAQYAYVASHDLQEPLRKIRVFAGLLKGSRKTVAENAPTIEKISGAAERMSLLIQDLLAFSRLLKSDTLMRPVPLQETVTAVWDDFELLVQEKSATIEIGALPVIQAVNLQMNQLFYNLINNALKFTEPGKRPHIGVASTPVTPEEVRRYILKPLPFSNYHHITVSDNGIGFETQYSEQIFEVFKRLHGRDLYPGSGIGLSLCRRIVANHHGHLYAESEIGKGSTFHVFLPDRQHDEISDFSGRETIFPAFS